MINMQHCMFENTSKAMQEIIDKMYEEDFNPNLLNKYELQAFKELFDQCDTLINRLYELDEAFDDEDEDVEAENYQEAVHEEYELHKNIVGEEQADEDFHTFTRKNQ